MNTQGLLDQLLKSASGALSGSSSTNKSQSTGGGSQLGSLLSGAGGGALAAGAGGLSAPPKPQSITKAVFACFCNGFEGFP